MARTMDDTGFFMKDCQDPYICPEYGFLSDNEAEGHVGFLQVTPSSYALTEQTEPTASTSSILRFLQCDESFEEIMTAVESEERVNASVHSDSARFHGTLYDTNPLCLKSRTDSVVPKRPFYTLYPSDVYEFYIKYRFMIMKALRDIESCTSKLYRMSSIKKQKKEQAFATDINRLILTERRYCTLLLLWSIHNHYNPHTKWCVLFNRVYNITFLLTGRLSFGGEDLKNELLKESNYSSTHFKCFEEIMAQELCNPVFVHGYILSFFAEDSRSSVF